MKRTILSLFVVFGLLSLTFSCAKDDASGSSATGTSTSSPNFFKAKVNGANFAVNLMNASVSSDIISFVAASSTSNKAVGIFLPVSAATGTYPTSQNGAFRITYTGAEEQNNLYSAKDNGTITITSHNTANKIIKGTFEADATHTSAGAANDTIKIREGEFIIIY